MKTSVTHQRFLPSRVIYLILGIVMLTGLALRTWNVNFDGGLNAHPDERLTTCSNAPTIGWPSSVGEFLDPRRSPLNPLWDRQNDHSRPFPYGHFPLYLGILTGELLNDLAKPARLLPLSDRTIALMERANTPCEGVAIAGRLLMALLDTLTILLLFLLGRRLYGAAGGLLAAGLYAFTAQAVQLSHFFAMDPASTTFITLAIYGGVLMIQERSWRGVLYAGIGAGLATSAKFSALPILAVPVAAALAVLWQADKHASQQADRVRRGNGVGRMLVSAPLALLLACAAFFITSPYVVLDWANLIQATLVGHGQMLVYGTDDAPFTRQFRNTTPYLYFIQQQVVWGMGLPLGLIALTGSGWALAKALVQRAKAGELIIWAWLIPYFGITGAFLAKFNRYMSPVLPFVLLFAAGLIVWLWRFGARRYSDGSQLRLAARLSAALLALTALGGGLFWSLAYVNGVYTYEHTWITASRWIYANAPTNSVILRELWWDYRLPLSIPGEPGMDMESHGLRNIDWGTFEEDTPEKYVFLRQRLREADYVIYSSQHVYRSVNELPERYPMTIRYYELMLGEQLGFVHAADFTSPPRLLGLTFPDQEADNSWSIFDHPRVSIFAKQRDLTDAEFDALLGDSWEGAHYEYRGKDSPLNAILTVWGSLIHRVQLQGPPLNAQSVISEWRPDRPEAVSRCDSLSEGGALCYCRSEPVPEEWPSRLREVGEPILFGDKTTPQVTLLGWELLAGESPQPTDTVKVRLYWQAHDRIDEEIHSFLHLYTPSLQRSWAVAHNRKPSCRPALGWHPGNYYVDDLHLTIPGDTPPVAYSLVAGLVSSSGERLAVPGSTDGLLHLRTLEVAPARPGFFQRRRFLRQERPTIVAAAETDDGLRLQGYDLLPAPGAPTLRLFWETGEGVASDWITYIHLHSPQGERIAQFDGPALAGLQPTSQWQTDSLYIDRRQLVLPAGLEPGDYLLRIGLYNFESGERMPFRPDFGDGQGKFEDGQLLVPLIVPELSYRVSGK